MSKTDNGTTQGTSAKPLVSVVTPFYNEAQFLDECISSVLAQDYPNFEYILVDNQSIDDSLAVVQKYAARDDRVRVYQNEDFLSQVDNFNGALNRISESSVYTKIVQGDDWLFPECLTRMVSIAESNPAIGVVSSYVLLGWEDRGAVYLDGLPVSQTIMPGSEVCRRFIRDGLYVFGSPSVSLIRSEIIRSVDEFYTRNSVVEDVDCFFEFLDEWSFAFVHQVLSYTRRDNASTISAINTFDLMNLTRMHIVHKYGQRYLDKGEYDRVSGDVSRDYYRTLGLAMIKRKPDEYWKLHRTGLAGSGLKLSRRKLFAGTVWSLLDIVLNPKQSLEAVLRKLK